MLMQTDQQAVRDLASAKERPVPLTPHTTYRAERGPPCSAYDTGTVPGTIPYALTGTVRHTSVLCGTGVWCHEQIRVKSHPFLTGLVWPCQGA